MMSAAPSEKAVSDSGEASQLLQLPKMFRCTYAGCGRTFSKSSNLRQHTRIHTGERPFACPVSGCGKRFRQSGNLTKHIRSHGHEGLRWNRETKHKPFKCMHPGCEKSFTAKSSLRIHMRLHTGEKPFACDFPNCGQRFHHKNALKQHQRVHQQREKQMFFCMHHNCGKGFETEAELKEHLARYNPGFLAEIRGLEATLQRLVTVVENVNGQTAQNELVAALEEAKAKLAQGRFHKENAGSPVGKDTKQNSESAATSADGSYGLGESNMNAAAATTTPNAQLTELEDSKQQSSAPPGLDPMFFLTESFPSSLSRANSTDFMPSGLLPASDSPSLPGFGWANIDDYELMLHQPSQGVSRQAAEEEESTVVKSDSPVTTPSSSDAPEGASRTPANEIDGGIELFDFMIPQILG